MNGGKTPHILKECGTKYHYCGSKLMLCKKEDVYGGQSRRFTGTVVSAIFAILLTAEIVLEQWRT